MVRLGSKDGIEARMNFADLDSTGLQIAAFYPHEILSGRFWSGRLAPGDYVKVRSGGTVIRVSLSTVDAALLREQFGFRSAALKEERLRRRKNERELGKLELEELLNDMDAEETSNGGRRAVPVKAAFIERRIAKRKHRLFKNRIDSKPQTPDFKLQTSDFISQTP